MWRWLLGAAAVEEQVQVFRKLGLHCKVRGSGLGML